MFWHNARSRKRQKRWLNLMRGLVLVGLIWGLSAPVHAPNMAYAENSASCAPAWTLIPSANTDSPGHVLNDAVALSANDVWAVGTYWGLSDPHALIEHWDGNQWQIIEGADLNAPISELGAVDASPTDVWILGSVHDGVTGSAALEHWDGVSWSSIPITETTGVNALKVISNTDIWAVGGKILHWDGANWTTTEIPLIGNESRTLNSIHAFAENDIWAVGFFSDYDEVNDIETVSTLTLHYDGTDWQIVPSPNPNPTWNVLASVHGTSPSDLWAVGQSNGYKINTRPLILHWDGVAWSSATNLNPSAREDALSDVFATSLNRATAVGYYTNANNHIRPLVMEWDGTAWTQRDTGTTKFASNTFKAVSAGADRVIWAVGASTTYTSNEITLSERFAAPIAKPSNLLPAKGTVAPKTRVKLDWSDAQCATRYEAVVRQDSKNGVLADSASNLAASKYKTIALPKGHTYYWRARGCVDDVCGKWSKWYNFTLQP